MAKGYDMGFAERLSSSCVDSNLSSCEGKIRAIEHVGALSGASSIGSDLMRARDYDAGALRRAILLIARKARNELRLGMGPAQQLSTVACLELMHWQCRICHGASEQVISGIRQTCPACGGTGVHRWRDKERAAAAGYSIDTWPAWNRKYEQVLTMARDYDSHTIGQAIKKMG